MHGTTTAFFIVVTVVVVGTTIGWFLFEATPRAKSPAPNIAAHSQEATDFYRACMAAPEDTSSEHFWVFQESFCECSTEMAVEQLAPQDIRIIVSRATGGAEAVVEALSKLSDAQIEAYVTRADAFQAEAIPKCMKVGMAARKAAREAM